MHETRREIDNTVIGKGFHLIGALLMVVVGIAAISLPGYGRAFLYLSIFLGIVASIFSTGTALVQSHRKFVSLRREILSSIKPKDVFLASRSDGWDALFRVTEFLSEEYKLEFIHQFNMKLFDVMQQTEARKENLLDCRWRIVAGPSSIFDAKFDDEMILLFSAIQSLAENVEIGRVISSGELKAVVLSVKQSPVKQSLVFASISDSVTVREGDTVVIVRPTSRRFELSLARWDVLSRTSELKARHERLVAKKPDKYDAFETGRVIFSHGRRAKIKINRTTLWATTRGELSVREGDTVIVARRRTQRGRLSPMVNASIVSRSKNRRGISRPNPPPV